MPKRTSPVASALAVVSLQAACGGEVQRNSPEPVGRDASANDAERGETGSAGSDAASGKDATPDPCAPENQPICGTLRERVVYTDSGECVIYVPHMAGDPRPFDPNVLAMQVGTAGGPRKLTYVTDASGCSAGNTDGVLGWYFTAMPPRLVFCPVTCNVIRTEASDVVELLVGCASVCPPP